MRVLICGAGGHGQVVADILLRMKDTGSDVTPIGYLDEDRGVTGQMRLGLPILGTAVDLSSIAHDALILAIGDNKTRQRLFERLKNAGERFATARHPSAVIAPDVQLGPGSVICAGVIANPASTIGANVILNTACTIDHHNHIGDHAHIGPGVHLGGEVRVGEGVLIGIGATVMPRRRIGHWTVVGAGALVHTDLPDNVVAVGVPAQVIHN
jgi:sugar O-acyltransferase (sialic acid O-acetyltransferase NeuD family)